MTTATQIAPAEFATMRAAMVSSQLRTTAVADPRVVAAMAMVPRERFMPAGGAMLAYRDTAVPLGQGRSANLPMATGRLLNEARLRREDRVLLIGAASGYTAAVLAELVTHVVAVESDPALAAMARAALGGDPRIEIVEAPLEIGHAEGAPYDVLMVDGAVAHLPETLASQLVPGGRIVTGLIENGVMRLASGRATKSTFGLTGFVDCDCVPLPGFAVPRKFTF